MQNRTQALTPRLLSTKVAFAIRYPISLAHNDMYNLKVNERIHTYSLHRSNKTPGKAINQHLTSMHLINVIIIANQYFMEYPFNFLPLSQITVPYSSENKYLKRIGKNNQ